MILVPALVIGLVLIDPIVGEIQEIANTRDQNKVRLELWANGIEAGLQRPVFGLGPGAWSGFDGPRGLEEAHNSPIDYFTNAGLIGAALLLYGMCALFFRTLLSKQAVLLAGITAVTIFALFHNVLRQPIMWLVMYYVAQRVWQAAPSMADGRGRQSRRRSRRVRSRGPRVSAS